MVDRIVGFPNSFGILQVCYNGFVFASTVRDPVIHQHGVITRLNRRLGQFVIAELQMFPTRIFAIIEEVILVFEVGPRENGSFILVLCQTEIYGIFRRSKLHPFVITILDFDDLLEITVIVEVLFYIFISQHRSPFIIISIRHTGSRRTVNTEIFVHTKLGTKLHLLHSVLRYIKVPRGDIAGIAVGGIRRAFYQRCHTVFFLVERVALLFVLAEDESSGTRHDVIAVSVSGYRPYDLFEFHRCLHQGHAAGHCMCLAVHGHIRTHYQRIMVYVGLVLFLGRNSHQGVTRFVDPEIRISSREGAITRYQVKRFGGIYG